MRARIPWRQTLAGALLLAPLAAPATAQDTNVLLPVDSIERLLRYESFEIIDKRGSRFEQDRTSRVGLQFSDGTMIAAKWAPAADGGEAFNNSPRFETATYELQKLFLDEPHHVVPPTVIRAFDLGWYRSLNSRARATLPRTESAIVTLQYWLFNVSQDDFWDEKRFQRDTTYARHFANFNLLTHLANHNDENIGNFLISRDPANPRVFSVDNGLAFSSRTSDRGARWRRLRVDRIPADAVERLRALTEDDLIAALETVAEFRIAANGTLQPVPPSENIDPNKGIRQNSEAVQFGLTRWELRRLWNRIGNLVEEVDEGKIEVF